MMSSFTPKCFQTDPLQEENDCQLTLNHLKDDFVTSELVWKALHEPHEHAALLLRTLFVCVTHFIPGFIDKGSSRRCHFKYVKQHLGGKISLDTNFYWKKRQEIFNKLKHAP